jgi:flavodoxin
MKKLLFIAALLLGMAIFGVGTRLRETPKNFGLEAQVMKAQAAGTGKILVAYFTWSGNTGGIARQIQQKTGGDLFEIECVTPYSSNYNACLEEAQKDQREAARPALKTHVADIAQYGVIFLGYPNWWASIPMPIASFLEEYNLSSKTIIPFCSHGGGRFGQSLTAIAKLAPQAKIGDALSVHYAGGNSLTSDISAWLRKNEIAEIGS